MEYNTEKAEEIALALLYLNLMRDRGIFRAWKTMPWEIMDGLHEKGLISDPATKAKSVRVTEEGREAAKEMFKKYLTEARR